GGITKGLTHPSLIIGLCEMSEAKIQISEETAKPQSIITQAIVNNYQCWEQARARVSGLGYVLVGASSENFDLPKPPAEG
ncbi:hypothetical protein TorRG33x02_330690, partial [Trema orientale]